MTELLESVQIGFLNSVVGNDEKCKKKDDSKGWEANIIKWGTRKNCTGENLYKNMEKKAAQKGGYDGGYVGRKAFVAKSSTPTLNDCDKDKFPLQAHHLIPKNHLPTHGVCAFLAKGYKKHPEFQLKEDTYYDTDHAFNGYCLPYATPLKEWKKAGSSPTKKNDVAFALMKKTNRQLHQGSHKDYQYNEDVENDEESEDPGYLAMVDALLDVVRTGAEIHTNICKICKPSDSKKEIHPRRMVVKHMDQVSGLLKHLMDANKIFVSERAYLHFHDKKITWKEPDWLSE